MNAISPLNSLWQQLSSTKTSQATPINTTMQVTQNVDSVATSSTSTPGVDDVQMSDPGKLFQQLNALSQSDPTEFKKITAQIASQLQTAAGQSSNSTQASFLKQMAADFQNASQSGKFSDLFPQASQNTSARTSSGTPPAIHHHHHAGADADTSQSDSVANIFTEALEQIKTDLGSASSATVKS